MTDIVWANLTSPVPLALLDDHMVQKDGLSSSTGAAGVGYIEAGTNAIDVSVQNRLRNEIWTDGFDGTATQKVQRAIDAAEADGGGTVRMRRNVYTLGDINIPASVILKGDGSRATAVTYSGSGTFALLGGTAGANYYGCGISDLAVFLTTNTAEAIRAKGTVGAEIARLYLQGYINAGRTNHGVVLDGGNASSFFNKIDSVICNHMENSFSVLTSGSVSATCQYFANCSALGDVAGVGSASIGFAFAQSQGQGSVVSGGNIEACGTGILFATSGRVTFIGTRFEGDNTIDIQFNVSSAPSSFFGLSGINLSKVVDNSGTGAGMPTFIGCIDQTLGAQYPNHLCGTSKLESQKITDIPCTIMGYPTQTGKLLVLRDGSNNIVGTWSPDGEIFGAGHFGVNGATPQGKYSVSGASTDLPTVIALANQLRAALVANGIAV